MGYQGTLIAMIQTLTNVYGQFMGASAAFDQLFTIMDTHSTVVDDPAAVFPPRVEGRLEFRHVTFGYDTTPVLSDLNIDIPYGQTVALVGRSGCGKTTLTNLLMRFYDPQAGAICLDGTDIRRLPLRAYRALFGVVLQDPYLFDASVAVNLRYADPDATDDDLRDALQRAQAWEFVQRFAEGMHHRIGEGGGQVSGGQRQRLAIARCLLLRSRFVLLDEATSALDVESEATIQKSLDALFVGRTVLVIAHRLSTIRRAHRILVMDQGRLVEQGHLRGTARRARPLSPPAQHRHLHEHPPA